jgi:transposase, IS30 family
MPPLTREQRYQIECDLRSGFDQCQIAQRLLRSKRTIEREIARCGSPERYTADRANEHRRRCAAKSAANQRKKLPSLWRQVEVALLKKHSPEQIVHVLKLAVSVAAIYRYVRRSGKKRLLQRLRHYQAAKRRGKMAWVKKVQPIKKRDKAVLTRDCIGHLEGDSIVGRRNEPIKVLVVLDRATRFVRLGLVRDGTAAKVAWHLKGWMTDPRIPLLTLTCDQGYEFAHLPELLPNRLYACDPGKPYQKGAVENINGLIRQYIPKGKSLRHVTQAQLNRIAEELNNRPRKRLGWKSPAQVLFEMTAATTS